MFPFNTKVYSDVHSPFRIAFKLSDAPQPDYLDYYTPYYMVLKGFEGFSAPDLFTHFSCIFKEYTSEPSEAPQSPLSNSYRNWKQSTQFIPLYAYCSKTAADTIEIEMPRIKHLSIFSYYELVILPTGPSLPQTGFDNYFDSEFRLIAMPTSCEYIGEWLYYNGHMF